MRGPVRCVTEACPSCPGQARRVAVQKHINQFHEGETLASLA